MDAHAYRELVCQSIIDNLQQMAGYDPEIISAELQADDIFVSKGFVVLVGITGAQRGRIIFDVTRETARELSKQINEEDFVDDELMINTLSELGNIVSGNIITKINNVNKQYNLTLAPPSIFIGDRLSLTSPKIASEKITVSTPSGPLIVSFGLERGA